MHLANLYQQSEISQHKVIKHLQVISALQTESMNDVIATLATLQEQIHTLIPRLTLMEFIHEMHETLCSRVDIIVAHTSLDSVRQATEKIVRELEM